MARFLSLVVLGLGAAVLGIGTPPAAVAQPARPAETDTELVRRVQEGIKNGVAYLKDQAAKNNGNWDQGVVLKSFANMDGGATALAVLALLNAGVPPDDPAVASGLKYLRELKPAKTYVVALQTMALSEALVLSRDKRDLPLLQRNVEWFQQKAIRSKSGLEGWSYPANAVADNSNTQYALLGLYAAKVAGVKIDDALWKEVQEFYTRTQKTDPKYDKAGFWLYHNASFGPNSPQEAASFTMSVGGVCGLLIASMGLDASEQGLDPKTGVAAQCGQYPDSGALAKGMFWVGAHFSFEQGKSFFYNYYGLERLGRLSGQRFIGTFDWYREGCKNLLARQDPSGAFVDRTGKGLDSGYPVITTSFALLFLSKGRTPVLVTKFAWGNAARDKVAVRLKGVGGQPDADAERQVLTELTPDGKLVQGSPNWNRKHNDCRNVVEFAQREIFDGAPLSWQVYDPRLLNLTDADIDFEVGLLLQSPVLYLNGHGPMPFVTRTTDNALSVPEKMLKKYVEEGGFLFAEACCGDRDFRASFENLVDRIFPGSALKKLPPEHAIWGMFPGVDPNEFPDLMCVERGCRTVAVFSPSPLAGYWEERKYLPADGRVPKNRGEMAFCLARNVIAYATGMELPKPKLTRTLLVAPDSGVARSKFRALQLRYSTDAKSIPADGALRNLMAFLGDKAKLDVALTSTVMVPASPDLARYKFMYLHGRPPIAHRGAGGEAAGFAPDERDNIKANLQTGGLLLADAACNGDIKQWRAFDKSFRDAMAQMFPDQKLQVIPPGDPLYKIAAQAGIDLGAVKCRRENAEGTGPEKEMRTYPVLLEGIKIDEQLVDGKKVGGRWAVVYSKYDIGCAIEGHKSGECLGHDKESALRIASAVALYSLRR